MGQSLKVNKHTVKFTHKEIDKLLERISEFTLEVIEGKQRTPTQNNALHKFCELLAEALNDAGLDMRVVLKPEIEIPWDKTSAKKHLWKPIQKALTEKESTTDADTTDYSKVYEVLNRHMGEKHGIHVPWPSKETKEKA